MNRLKLVVEKTGDFETEGGMICEPQVTMQIQKPEDIANVLRAEWDKDGDILIRERFKAAILSRSNHVLAIFEVGVGGVNRTTADQKLVFPVVLKAMFQIAGASAFMVAHNHPSGNLTPSQADLNLTEKFQKAAAALDITFHDHIIITESGYRSLADDGFMI